MAFTGIDISYIYFCCIILQLLLLFAAGMLLYSIGSRWTTAITICLILFLCVRECYYGITQLLGYHFSNHYLFALTGSFLNPGPLGGFLAISISLLVAYVLLNEEKKDVIIFNKILLILSAVVIAAALPVLLLTQSRSAILALLCSGFLMFWGKEKVRIKLGKILKKCGILIIVGLIIFGCGAYRLKKSSADGRLFIDRICLRAICTNGFKGSGIGHFGKTYGQVQADYFREQISKNGKDDLDWRAINEHDRLTAECPNNAFNEYLFIGVEAGPIVMLLFAGIVITAIVVSFKRGTIWCFGLTTYAVFAMFSYPLHVVQLRIMLPILIAACLSDKFLTQSVIKKRMFMWGQVVSTVSFCLLLVLLLSIQTDLRLYKEAVSISRKIERWHQSESYEYVVEDGESLLQYLKRDYKYLFAYGQSLNKIGNYAKSDSVLILGTEACCDPMFWNVMGNNSLAQGKFREAESRYKNAFYMLPNRLYPLYLLAKLYYIEGDRVKFLEMADIVESFIPKVKSANTDRLRFEIRELKKDYMLETDTNEIE